LTWCRGPPLSFDIYVANLYSGLALCAFRRNAYEPVQLLPEVTDMVPKKQIKVLRFMLAQALRSCSIEKLN
jgi:hypothetical protein